jgi:histidine ammonia-lyase
MPHTLSHKDMDIDTVYRIAMSDEHISILPETLQLVQENRQFLESKISDPTQMYYGINTGFGSLCNVQISASELQMLQENLVKSHACGMGDEVPLPIIRLIFLLKILNLCKGASGVRPTLIKHMVAVYNAGIMPVVFTQGSLGASGDLAPLAHLSCTLIGVGDCYHNGKKIKAIDALTSSDLEPIKLEAKEGLALLNGTQFSLAYSVFILQQVTELWPSMTKIAAMSVDAFMCHSTPFHHLLQDIRPHHGQRKVAADIYALLSTSPMQAETRPSVQDPYSFRCIPQVMGASLVAIDHAKEVVSIELNSVTDNPMIFHEDDKIMSGGNFHAQPLALVLDYLAIALAELGSISERRVYQLINGDRGLPPFLTQGAGLNSGCMIIQYTAASIASQNKQYCTPASVDSIVSSKGQEDHVSMAANGATKCLKVWDNIISLMAIEWIIAAQALDLRRPLTSSKPIEDFVSKLRDKVPFIDEDRYFHDDLMNARQLLMA